MADTSGIGLFCTKFLLHNECSRGSTCIFIHANMHDVHLFSNFPKDGEDYVKGFLVARSQPKGKNKHRMQEPHNHSTKLPCYYNSTGVRCPYGSNCVYKHTNDTKLKTEHSGVNLPSTSSHNSASSSSSSSSVSPDTENMNPPSSSSTGSKKKVTKNFKTNTSHTVTSGALERENNTKKAEVSKNLWNLKSTVDIENWANAPEFIPKSVQNFPELVCFSNLSLDEDKSKRKLCPFSEREGLCKYPPGECMYLHGDICDLCGRPALHPFNEEQRKLHTQECIKQHERDMELSFAIARSKEKVCGICFEVIMQKSSVEQRFGILPNCNHCFCLACIRRWRQAKQFENKIIRACPECRVTSDFVCPSTYWVDTKEEKDKVIENYKQVLSKKDCKYFKKGNGSCPFGNKCFYLHAMADGTKVDVGPPPSHRTVSFEIANEVELIQRLLMVGYLRDNLDFEDILNIVDLSDVFSDSDDSMFSEYEYLSDF